jgi:predicted RNA binding protein YcfA (HicA-like mRNA interferase family)
MATKKLKINFKMPTPTAAERLHAQQQKNRKAAGLPDPSEYKKKLDSMKTEEVNIGDKVSFDHPMTAVPGKTMKKVGTVHKIEGDTAHVKVKDKYGVMTHKKNASELKKENYEEDDGPLSQEQLDEISAQLKASYVSGAKKQIKQSMPFTKKTDEYRDIAKNFIAKRQKGIAKANEEVELLDEMPESSMKTRDVHSHLKKSGWELARSKGGHDVYKHPKAKHSIPVPRHNQLKAPLIRGIMKASKVEESFRIGGMGSRGANVHMYDRNPGPRDGSELENIPSKPKTELQKRLKSALTDLGKKMKETHPKLREAKDSQEYDYEGDMAKSDLRSIMHHAKELHDMLDDDTNLAEWCQSKITLAEDYLSTVANYMRSEMDEEVEIDEMIVVKTNKPIGTRVADIGPGGKEYNVKTDKAYDDAKKKQPQGAEFAAQRRKERLAKNGRMDEKENLPGLWANIHAKRKRGESPAKPGDKDYPKNLETVRNADKESVKESHDVPFNKPYKQDTGTTTDKSGAKHTPMSKARNLARQALSRTSSKKADTKQQARNAFDGMFGGGNPANKLGIMKKESASEPVEEGVATNRPQPNLPSMSSDQAVANAQNAVQREKKRLDLLKAKDKTSNYETQQRQKNTPIVNNNGSLSMKKESASEPTEGEMKGKQGYSRKAQIVMNAAKGKKSDNPDKFQKDPELSSEIHKT